MTNEKENIKVNAFIDRLKQWQEEFKILREIINETELTEDYKWMHPCYTLDDKNVVIIQDFKHYCALLFEKGAIMEDPYQSLIQQTKNVQAARQLRFESLDEVNQRRDEIKWYVEEAIRIEKSGKKVPMKKTEDYDMPEELQAKLDAMPKLKEAFSNLTTGRQRQYMYHIGQAKRAATRENRVEKYIDYILDGKGMND
ncbi:YdeI/OmpD-associated family protein [Staphylococcus saprophyticus]|uniref:YdeI/OmpD-associated family protein n=1 Tax=Staphylococcus saprophyticus TaxID=29385 RepID=UPI001981BF59|nr:YdeI/OmpD-associated family protein [Staphylococcus saprophyticus]MBN6094176.1 YdeI/OmpD-associated family protein [Staphylococcus saprophyticus]MBN6097714.1 YdeI/OmpD-associated family protein [Staphylococcus saprophyticus]MBN6099863.1 YdeI/OmpD-associated family protein [Staphylococcus saprophyticus]MDW4267984.1 YdeI/OmpD-associated family protein [Staphylococcus saprophyticus]MDW4330760.1 YdeI/OmpD-associated family protein [Staphylococcus saprophyticus]